ncbi:hypothetical protein GALMADRAFT_1355348 [Galerina marginata CBS 339.88]|uniref:Pyridoxamine 5'-phosphate oxidase N-terminal domain-containing protein n=1 Tax=Galerina marginata (strain CBS 339.88) TaxID=685588 RepID=A0A067SDE5_GALM3|nr:hypothetical protein GALMADRAFT_1355348 [Galerina marginata CBS 339.88]
MGKFFTEIPNFLVPWIKQQKMFWVATAPLSESGHVNVSPKGYEGTFHIVDENTVWYEDMSGSGVETIAHIRENGRMTIMFNAFEGPPQIVRLFGYGQHRCQVFEFDSPEYNSLIPLDQRQPGSRSVIMLNIHKVGTSCGYSIPFYAFKAHRIKLHAMAAHKEGEDFKAETSTDISSSPGQDSQSSAVPGPKSGSQAELAKDSDTLPPLPKTGLKWYWKNNNKQSIDGLPGIQTAWASKTVFDKSIISKDWGKDDERVPADVQVMEKTSIDKWVDPKVVLGFILGMLVSGLWVNLAGIVGLKIRAW